MVGDLYVWLAGVVPSSERPGEHEANARLIAAAPDLLAALKALLREEPLTYEGSTDAKLYCSVDALAAARAAIAKAEGES